MEPHFVIKPSTAEQTEQIVDLILTIQQKEFNIPITAEDQPDLMIIDKFYKEPGGEFLVAMQNDKVVGSIGLINIGKGNGAIRKMFVHKDFRGKTLGIAQSLLEAVIAHAKSKSINSIYLGTVTKLEAALRFYERNGFERLDKSTLPAEFPVMELDNVFCVLHLGDDK